ncbi:hypothetical protein YDYSY3_60730 [Paenibacillus chitinolyticus]|uniref:hypothetical protein n=1 Tax=Paenibacillus chitinolyticus TaxID=79263 RepID=UPI0026E4A7F1|nr:hypothetical protein [Paenibacillus chitinolyticus]GKS15073.1 hypothetical protein YDYSY3_60730 [Paenibacillus chitinolyticus]
MLADLDRKVLRILFHFSRNYGRMPDLKELETKTGKAAPELAAALARLRDGVYIMGSRLSEVVIIESEERQPEKKVAPAAYSTTGGGGMYGQN